MPNRRAARVASAIFEEVARQLLTGIKDPRLAGVSLTEVRVNDDLSVARISWLPLGGVGNRVVMGIALAEAAPQMRGPVGRAIGLRHAPELRFEIDRNIEYAAHMDEVFKKLPPPAEDPS